jgi:hypothetical protein
VIAVFKVEPNAAKTILYITLSGHFDLEEAQAAADRIMAAASQMGPVFDVVTDMRKCQPVDAGCLAKLQQVLEYMARIGLRRVIRVTQIVLSALQVDRVSREAGVDFISVHSLTDAERLLAEPSGKDHPDAGRKWDRARRYRRIVVGPEHTARFRVGGRDFDTIRLTNFSAQGCFAVMENRWSGMLHEGAILVDFSLEHPDLPSTMISAKILRLERNPRMVSDNDIGLGMMFLTTSPQFIEQIDSYVAAKTVED